MEELPLNQLVNAAIFKSNGDIAGTIEELLIDPHAGLVRFALIRTVADEHLVLPWAAMTYAKSGTGFILTHLGEDLWTERVAQPQEY